MGWTGFTGSLGSVVESPSLAWPEYEKDYYRVLERGLEDIHVKCDRVSPPLELPLGILQKSLILFLYSKLGMGLGLLILRRPSHSRPNSGLGRALTKNLEVGRAWIYLSPTHEHPYQTRLWWLLHPWGCWNLNPMLEKLELRLVLIIT